MILVDILLLPLRAVRGTATDMYEILKTWKRYALEYEANYRRQQVHQLLITEPCLVGASHRCLRHGQLCCHSDDALPCPASISLPASKLCRLNLLTFALLARLKTPGGPTARPGCLKRPRL